MPQVTPKMDCKWSLTETAKYPKKWTANEPRPRTQMTPKMDSKWSLLSTASDPERKIRMAWTEVTVSQYGTILCIMVYYHNTKCKTNLQRLIGTTEKNHQTTETSSGHRISAKSVNKTLNCFKQHLTQVLSLGTDYYFVYSGWKLNCRNCLWTYKKRRALLKNRHVLNSTILRGEGGSHTQATELTVA